MHGGAVATVVVVRYQRGDGANNYSVVPAAAQMAAQFTDVETSKRYELFDLAGLTVGAYKEGTNDTDLPTTIKQDPEAELILNTKPKKCMSKVNPKQTFNSILMKLSVLLQL